MEGLCFGPGLTWLACDPLGGRAAPGLGGDSGHVLQTGLLPALVRSYAIGVPPRPSAADLASSSVSSLPSTPWYAYTQRIVTSLFLSMMRLWLVYGSFSRDGSQGRRPEDSQCVSAHPGLLSMVLPWCEKVGTAADLWGFVNLGIAQMWLPSAWLRTAGRVGTVCSRCPRSTSSWIWRRRRSLGRACIGRSPRRTESSRSPLRAPLVSCCRRGPVTAPPEASMPPPQLGFRIGQSPSFSLSSLYFRAHPRIFHLGSAPAFFVLPFHCYPIILWSDVAACSRRSTKIHPPQSARAPGLASVRPIVL